MARWEPPEPGDTRAHAAARRGDGKEAELQIIVGAQVMRRFGAEHAALHGDGNFATTNAAGDTPLHVAARGAQCVLSRILRAADLVENAPEYRGLELGLAEALAARDANGATPLHLATEGQNCDGRQYSDSGLLRALVRLGADPDARDFDGWTPLHYACAWQNEEAVWALLRDCGANPLARTHSGIRPEDIECDDRLFCTRAVAREAAQKRRAQHAPKVKPARQS